MVKKMQSKQDLDVAQILILPLFLIHLIEHSSNSCIYNTLVEFSQRLPFSLFLCSKSLISLSISSVSFLLIPVDVYFLTTYFNGLTESKFLLNPKSFQAPVPTTYCV